MLKLFDKKYKACSNIFVWTYDDKHYTFPAPLGIQAVIENEQKNTKNEVEFRFDNFNDSLLTLDYIFGFFIFLLTFEYKIESVYIRAVILQESNHAADGYTGKYTFNSDDLTLNIGLTEIFDDYQRNQNKKTTVPN